MNKFRSHLVNLIRCSKCQPNRQHTCILGFYEASQQLSRQKKPSLMFVKRTPKNDLPVFFPCAWGAFTGGAVGTRLAKVTSSLELLDSAPSLALSGSSPARTCFRASFGNSPSCIHFQDLYVLVFNGSVSMIMITMPLMENPNSPNLNFPCLRLTLDFQSLWQHPPAKPHGGRP